MAPFFSAVALGLLVAFGFQPFGIWPLALIGYAGLALLIQARSPRARAAFAIGWGFGLGQFVLGLDWIATAFTYQAKMPGWLGWIAVLLLSLYLAVFPGLAALGAWWTTRRIGGGAATLSLALGACWGVSEWLRGTLFTGFPWNPAAAAFVDLPLAQLARITGTYGLSAIIVASSGFILILAALPRERLGRKTMLSSANLPAAAGLLLLAGLYFAPGIAVRIGRPDPLPPGTGPRVTVIQPDIGQGERWDPQLSRRHLQRLIALSGRPGDQPRVLLWPESAIEDFVTEDPAIAAALAPVIGPRDVLIAGGVLPVRDAGGAFVAARNSAFAIGPGGRILGRYDKAHLVPYGEYLPMRPLLSLLGLSRLAPGDVDFLPGPGPRTLALPGGLSVAVQICYEMIFSGHVVDEAHRPDFLFNPSNDAWFGPSGPPQHLAQARLRAIEEGLPIARATPTGISAIIAPDGRIVRELGAHAMGMTSERLPAARPRPIFTYLGDGAVWLIALLLGLMAIAAGRYKESFI
ncbi:apolipoprotein N-acyltransferase [Sphingomonas morindae]|uniref:Apolipoprotein N-acyltransferase n=1 Tax=Sphingomonas morindae TaxID=1541170 RepID=A0ABY4XAY8_9SPHN|nr:apolipoprotein N-acyltransferase [Sphingomonas morindae]USI73865.1 apolipoprotein N-acyltransferase [Sphingomonas morindae]